jgi:CPA1 family monovalent cation:H+ antiporter
MEAVIISLMFLLAVVVSGWIARALPIPAPLVQIGLGVAIVMATGKTIDLEPDVFFLLFLPPLLFIEGWRIPKAGLLNDWRPILQMAVGLVVFTVLGGGLIIHWLIPDMPLTVAFALAAVISPTDPVALSAIARGRTIPPRLQHILEGESLLNDASGLVCLRVAVGVVVTGSFSLLHASGLFLWLAACGIACGVAVTFCVNLIKGRLTRWLGEEPGTEIIISLLIPMGAYLLAELLRGSGILAAVAAGITMSYAEQSGRALPATRLQRGAVWDTVQFALNGVIFVLLGEQFPSIMARAEHLVSVTGHRDPMWMLFYILAITVALGVLRFCWVWLSFALTRIRRKGTPIPTNFRLIAVTSVAGVRGALTLAGVLTIPFAVASGDAFPVRNLVIFLAAGVIIASLLIATFLLPVLLKGLDLPEDDSAHGRIQQARVRAARAAMKAIEALRDAASNAESEVYSLMSNRASQPYHDRLKGLEDEAKTPDQRRVFLQLERDFRRAGLRAERDAYYQMGRSGELPDDLVRKLVSEIDLLEERLNS